MIIFKNKSNELEEYEAGFVDVGQTFHGTVGAHTGYFVRSFIGLIYLNNPSKTWYFIEKGPTISNYRKVDLLITELEEKK